MFIRCPLLAAKNKISGEKDAFIIKSAHLPFTQGINLRFLSLSKQAVVQTQLVESRNK